MATKKLDVVYGLRLVVRVLLLFWIFQGAVGARDWGNIDPGPYVEVGTGFSYVDNVFRKDEDEESDFLFVAAPDLSWKGLFGKHFLAVRYAGEYAKYFSLDEQDYDDHTASIDFGFGFTEKFNVDIGGSYVKSHDRPQEFGTNLEDFRSPTRWNEKKVQGRFTYGRRRLGAAEVGLSLYGKQRRYTNNDQEGRDRDGVGVILGYDQPLMPQTRLLTQFRYNRSDFKNLDSGGINQDNEGYSLWLGGSWAGTEYSTAQLLVGYIRQISDSALLDNFSGVGVEAELFWRLQPHSSVVVEAVRMPQESDDSASGFFLSNRLGISWRHDFEDFIRFDSGIEFRYDDFNSKGRIEKYALANVGLTYLWTKSVELGCEYRFKHRDSSVQGKNYQLNLVNLFIKVSPTLF